MLNQIFHSFINSLIFFVSCTNLPLRLSNRHRAFLYIYIVISCFLPSAQNPAVNFLVLIGLLLLVAVFSSHKLLNTCFSLAGYICNITISHLLYNLWNLFFDINADTIHEKYSIPFHLLLFFTILMTIHLLNRVLRNKLSIHELQIEKSIQLLILCDLLLCGGFFTFNYVYSEQIGYPLKMIIINGTFFCLYFIFTSIILVAIILIIRNENAAQSRLNQLEELQHYTRELETLYKDLRIFKHDYMNILSTMEGYLTEEDLPGLRSYFHTKVLPISNEINGCHAEIGKLGHITDLELKGLLYTKLINSMTKNIKVQLYIPMPASSIAMNILDLCRILGIFLDNAIEAASETTSRCIDISLVQSDELSVTIGNTCVVDTLPLSNLDTMGFSTKGEHRGIGLHTVSEILMKYPNVIHSVALKDYYFVQKLEIK